MSFGGRKSGMEEAAVQRARERAMAGRRLSVEDAAALYEDNDLTFLGRAARAAKERASGRDVYYTVNEHINLTNICRSGCPLCAFQTAEGDPRGFVLGREELAARLARLAQRKDLSEVHIVSALHPTKPFSYYEGVVRQVKRALPQVFLQAFTPVEIVHFAQMTGMSFRQVLERLRQDGLDGLPGGGAEIFAPRVRQEICPKKATAEEWLSVMRTAGALGIAANASMLYGHIETVRERFEHLAAIRQLQDETGVFSAFLLFPFHPAHTALGEERHLARVSAWEDMKMMALSRLMLDNVPHLKAFWVMLTLPVAQLALGFGADDLDGTIGEERIIHAAGARTGSGISKERLRRVIRETGYQPVERDARYRAKDAAEAAESREGGGRA